MSFSFHPEAEIEFNGAIDYYEKIVKGEGSCILHGKVFKFLFS